MMKLKRIILIGIGIFFLLVIAGVIYGVSRVSSVTDGEGALKGTSLPETNPFEIKSNPFEFFKNPFDDTSSITGSRLRAQVSAGKITFSITELGGCSNPEECRAFCNQIKNLAICIDFAEKNSMMSSEDLAQARRFAKAGGVGPGGCANKNDCENYCSNLDHIEECVAFAEKYGILPAKDLQEAQNIRRYLKEGGVMPGGCKSKENCMDYCKAPLHMRICLDFAERANLIPPQELAEARKVMPFLERGETPGGCLSKKECDSYCSQLNNMQECLSFAEKAGVIPAEELYLAKKILPFMLRGETPGKCLSQKECESYCRQPPHFRECLDFAEKAGFLNRIERMMLNQAVKLIPQ
ncbi:MAG: hypothetical protein HYW89_04240 [Candidatus Sungiibacteriota bacterium]|uniref:Uncharacterized protein n=1 Tax=Candidatus Sungiibacteriota bacterium TaxID=2750080 RepID=A0A7T5RJD2_9BACT|nr:MAG: hypothetical protein HYW89_04240 [Candidatus Sungbacteria bacterium]